MTSDLTGCSVLIVEGDETVGEMLADLLTERGASVNLQWSGEFALQSLGALSFHVAVVDLALPDMSGLQFLRRMKMIDGAVPILMGEAPCLGQLTDAMRLGAADFLLKPFDLRQAARSVARAFRRNCRQKERHAQVRRMRDVMRRVLDDRRELKQRTDLICRDIVCEYQRLARIVSTHLTGARRRSNEQA